MARPTLIIDDVDFSKYVNFVSLRRRAHFFDKYAKRDIQGVLHRELIGVYINFVLEIGIFENDEDNPNRDSLYWYNQLWEKLTEHKEFHNITISSNTHGKYNNYTFTAYLADIEDEGMLIRDNHNVFKGLKVEFIAKSPHKVSNNYH